MKKIVLLLILITNAFIAQESKTIYLPETEVFAYPDVFVQAGIKTKVKVTFDVQDLVPQNIKVEPLDSTRYEIVEEMTVGNLDSLIFINDVKDYSIIFEYTYSENISNNYVEYVKPGYIKAVFRKPNTKIIERNQLSAECNNLDSSMYFVDYLYTDKPVKTKSQILVEIGDLDDESSIKIVRNNLPELEEEILNKSKKAMQGLIKETIKYYGLDCGFTPKRYFLKLKVVKLFGKYGYQKVY